MPPVDKLKDAIGPIIAAAIASGGITFGYQSTHDPRPDPWTGNEGRANLSMIVALQNENKEMKHDHEDMKNAITDLRIMMGNKSRGSSQIQGHEYRLKAVEKCCENNNR